MTHIKQKMQTLNFRVQYKGVLDTPSIERSPWIKFFFSKLIGNGVSHDYYIDQLQTDIFDTQLSYVMPKTRIEFLASALNVVVYTQLQNTHGQWVYCQAGATTIPLYEFSFAKGKIITKPLFVPNANHIPKGTLSIQLAPNAPILFEDLVTAESAHRARSQLQSESRLLLRSIAKADQTVQSHFKPTSRNLNLIDTFEFAGTMGSLPSGLYACLTTTDVYGIGTKGVEEYFLHVLQSCVLSRKSAALSEFITIADTERLSIENPEDVRILCRILAEIVTALVWHSPYITDKVRRPESQSDELTELFDIMRIRGGGDCEDDGCEILLELSELNNPLHKFNSSIMQKIKFVRSLYIFSMNLAGVSSATVDVDEYGKTQNMGAHMYVSGNPFHRFFNLVGNYYGTEKSPFIATSSIRQPISSHLDKPWKLSKSTWDYREDPRYKASQQLNILPLVLEGTGMLQAEGLDEDEPEAVEYINKDEGKELLDPMRHQFHYTPGTQSSFYQTRQVGITNELLKEGFPFISFYYVQRKNAREQWTRGSPFSYFTCADESMCTNSGIAFRTPVTDDALKSFNYLCQDFLPIIPLIAPPASFELSVNTTLLISLKEKLTSLNRIVPENWTVHSVPFILSLATANSPNWITKQLSLINLKKRIVGAEWQLESPTKESAGFYFNYLIAMPPIQPQPQYVLPSSSYGTTF